jgi:hypothetical protein
VLAGAFWSTQPDVTPSQVSATSQAVPLAARQVVPLLPGACWQVSDAPSHRSVVQGFPSSPQEIPAATFVSATGQIIAPPQSSGWSHSPAAARQTVLAGTALHVPTDPEFVHESQGPALHWVLQQTPSAQKPIAHCEGALHGCPRPSFASQTPPWQNSPAGHIASIVHPPHAVPLQDVSPQSCVWGAGHAAPLPGQLAATVATPAVQLAARQLVALDLKPSAGQASSEPSHVSATSQVPAAARQTVPAEAFASGGHVVEEPLHVSDESQEPAAARHTVPAFPAGWRHASLDPSQASTVQGLPSSAQLVPEPDFASAGQAAEVPSHFSTASQGPTASRHTTELDIFTSDGQAVATPSHVSGTSHGPAVARQVVPAFPAACAHDGGAPEPHLSVVHGLPSSAHAVPAAFPMSAGHATPLPAHTSATSQSFAAARQVIPAAYFWHPPEADPLQKPVLPHDAAPSSTHSLSGSVATLTAAQMPSVPPVFAAVQALQAAVQAVSQQTPSTQ